MTRPLEYSNLVLLGMAAVILVGLQMPLGWLFLAGGAGLLFFCERQFAKEIVLIFVSLGILGLTPIDTSIAPLDMLIMALTLTTALLVPYLIARYVYKNPIVKFKFHHGRGWYKKEVLYIAVAGLVSYFLLPFYLQNTGSYLNWQVVPELGAIIRLFIGTNALGIWDELFFICVVLGILRRHFSFVVANLAQAVLFTSFLFELGFRGWGPVMIFAFALLQGYIFRKTESLFYVITIHLTVDFILFLALIELNQPGWINIFPV